MKGLVDTHTFVWWDSNPSRLSQPARAFREDGANTIFLSVASVWEMVIKTQLGKMSVRAPLSSILAEQGANGIQILPITLDHVLRLEGLPASHRDPFDRLLIAQANVEGAVLLSADPVFAHYPVTVLW